MVEKKGNHLLGQSDFPLKGRTPGTVALVGSRVVCASPWLEVGNKDAGPHVALRSIQLQAMKPKRGPVQDCRPCTALKLSDHRATLLDW